VKLTPHKCHTLYSTVVVNYENSFGVSKMLSKILGDLVT